MESAIRVAYDRGMLIASILGGVAAVVSSVAILVRSLKKKKGTGRLPPIIPPPR